MKRSPLTAFTVGASLADARARAAGAVKRRPYNIF